MTMTITINENDRLWSITKFRVNKKQQQNKQTKTKQTEKLRKESVTFTNPPYKSYIGKFNIVNTGHAHPFISSLLPLPFPIL